MVRLRIDLGSLQEWPSDRIPDFIPTLLEALPGLQDHGCSYGEQGGFVRRLGEGTLIGHVIEHVAIELQHLAGIKVTRGKTRSVAGQEGQFDILFAYGDEKAGLLAGAAATRLVSSLLPPLLEPIESTQAFAKINTAIPIAVDDIVEAIRNLARKSAFGPSTQSIVDEAKRRHIPCYRLDDKALIQLGTGSRQRRIRASITGMSSHIAVELASNKNETRRLLREAGLPAPNGFLVMNADEAVAAAERVGFPVVVKPLSANHGRGVSLNIANEQEVRAAVAIAQEHGHRIVVEQYLTGHDYRFLVVSGKVAAVAHREPAHIIGDGERTIRNLAEIVNADPARGQGHANTLTKIRLDERTEALLARSDQSFDTVPQAGETVYLTETANLSTGGTAQDVTDEVHPANIFAAEQAVAMIGLDVAGVDFLSPDITKPVAETGGGIIEINAAPGLRMHLAPSSGESRDVARPIVKSLFPDARQSRIPVVSITGTNGKTTTAAIVAHIVSLTGARAGLATTSGIYVDGHLIKKADASGPKSAARLLRNPAVDVAVLETARGGMLREGLGFDYCDVGCVLNVTADHLGIGGIDSVSGLAKLKSIVVRNVKRRGFAILNADDPHTRKMSKIARGQIGWFSAASEPSEFLQTQIAEGKLVAHLEGDPDNPVIILHMRGQRHEVARSLEMPVTFGNSARFNLANAAAATAICAGLGINLDVISQGLKTFQTSFEDNPGRMNIREVGGIKIVMDYAHNPAALTALDKFLASTRNPDGKIIGVINVPGDRRDEDLVEMGRLAAQVFDDVIFREAPDCRGRAKGEISTLMAKGAYEVTSRDKVMRVLDECDATRFALARAKSGDLVVLIPTNISSVWEIVQQFDPAHPSNIEGLEVHGE